MRGKKKEIGSERKKLIIYDDWLENLIFTAGRDIVKT